MLQAPQWTDNSVLITFDTRVYRLSAVKKAAYKFAGQCRVDIDLSDDESQIFARLTALKTIERLEQDKFLERFTSEVLDQELREQIATETEAVRNLILAQAFSKTSLLEG